MYLTFDQIIQHLKFDEISGTIAEDSSSFGSDNFGQLFNGASFDKEDTVLSLDGIDDFVYINNSTDINVGTFAKKTISVWFKVDQFNQNKKQVIYEQGGITRGLNIYLDSDRLYVGGWNTPENESSWNGTYLSTGGLETNTWYNVALVLDAQANENSVQSGVFKAYLNGVKFGEGEGSQLWNHTDGIAIGGLNQATKFHDGETYGQFGFDGNIKNLQSYNRVLSEQEINQLAVPATDLLSKELVLQLDFEESFNNTLKDTSYFGKENQASLVGGSQLINDSDSNVVVELDGINDLVRIKNSTDINLGTFAKKTISVWFKVDQFNQNKKQVIYEQGGRTRGLNIYLDSDRLYVGGWNTPRKESGWDGTYLSTDGLETNTWYNVALVLDAQANENSVQSGVFKAYLNGVKFGEGEGSQLWNHSDGTAIGGLNQGTKFHDGVTHGQFGFDGQVDNYHHYNRALSEGEIIQLASSISSQPTHYAIGTNLHEIADWSPQVPFIDGFKSSREWTTQNSDQWIWDTSEKDKLNLDENGWVRSLPDGTDSSTTFNTVGTLLYHDIGGQYQGGDYVVLYEGEGTINYAWDAKLKSSTSGRDVIEVTPSDSGIYITITETDPNNNGNYLRNIRVVPSEYEDNYETEIFNPDFLEKIGSFGTLRFMDWMETNNSTQGEWSDRPVLDSYTWSENGVPVEVMVELANRLDVNPWFTIPHQATNEYVENFAKYVRDNLEPGLEVYVEYTNEFWNGIFSQGHWIEQQGINEYPNSSDSDFGKRIDWFSQRTTEITQIWDQVFGQQKDRVIGVMGAFTGVDYVAQEALNYHWTDNPLSHEEYGIDAIAIAPYFGHYLGEYQNKEELLSWIQESDGGLNKLFDELTKGGLLNNSPEGGALQQAYEQMQNHSDLADENNLKLLAYEGGQHLLDHTGSSQEIIDLFTQANRDERMGEIYKEYFQTWFELGGDEFVNFTDVSAYGRYGYWGALESTYQDNSPKYDAIMNLLD